MTAPLPGRLAAPVPLPASYVAALAPDGSLTDEIQLLRQAQTISRVGSWRYRPAGRVLTVSDALLDLYGLDRQIFIGEYTALDDCVHVDDRDALMQATEQLMTTGRPMEARYRVVRAADGRVRWISARGIAERDDTGTVTHAAGTVADVTELVDAELNSRRAHNELSQAYAFQQAVITATPDAIHIYDVATGELTWANRTGRPTFTDEVVRVLAGVDLDTLVPCDDLAELVTELAAVRALDNGEVRQVRHRVRQSGERMRWLSRRLTPFARDVDGRVTLGLIVSRDVTDMVEFEAQMTYAALHDELTGLPNRRLIHDRLEQAMLRAGRGGNLAVLHCDLDRFKRINDSHGHQAGDEVLVQAAARLIGACRRGDTVGRMGGDEFVVVLDLPESEDPVEIAQEVTTRILDSIARPIRVGQVEHSVSMSIGISLALDGGAAVDVEGLLSDADAAMYWVKARGANGYAFFQPAQRRDQVERDHIERSIRLALAEESVEVRYQPIVDPRTDALYGVEALVRIRDCDGRLLDTGKVVDVAEHTGLINELDAHVLRVACRQAARWRQEPELAQLRLSVNRSVRDITKPGFANRIVEVLTCSGLSPAALRLEITETVLLDATDANLADLRRLSELGVGLAIDDFGTGYASLRYLAELPIACIKIDRSFTARLPHDQTSMTLVCATIGLAEQLGINCVVEGVERIAQLDALPRYEGLLIQGYLYAEARSARAPLPSVLHPCEPVDTDDGFASTA
jgi:diguanylate cyclase (GGDEF)-like protein/PAS domain S-box-containing protein